MAAVLDALLRLGDPGWRAWLDYEAAGIGPGDEDALIDIIGDSELLWAEMHSPESWAPLHAWRALGQLRSERAIPSLVLLLDHCEDDDWLIEDLPRIFELLGPASILPLQRYLANPAHSVFPRAVASNGLVRLAVAYPALRDECVEPMGSVLERFEQEDPLLNSLIMGDLVELNAAEFAPLMKAAFDSGRIDIRHLGDWEDVQIELGLLADRLTPRARLPWFGEHSDPGGSPGRGNLTSRSDSRAKSKVKRKAAKQSRRRNRH